MTKTFKEKLARILQTLELLNFSSEILVLTRMGREGRVRSLYETLRYRIKGGPDKLPIPPSRLLFRVAGSTDISWFLTSGAHGFQSIVEILEKNGTNVHALGRILDFGCGCGRVMRHWRYLAGEVELHGTDYNTELIDWCKRNLTFARFSDNGLAPPLKDYKTEQFNFIYALSVFTHLTEELQLSWMDELCRVLKPGGLLLFTTHGEYYLNRLAPEDQRRFLDGQLIVQRDAWAGTNVCTAFHPREYVLTTLTAAHGLIIDFIPEGAKGNPFQDAHLLRKHTVGGRDLR